MKKILLCSLLGLIACEGDPLERNAIDSTIEIVPGEFYLASAIPQLALACKTERIYPCMNYPIHFEQSFVDGKLSITFTHIPELDICLTALGPATIQIDLSTLPNGEYELELNNAALKNSGTLKITDTEITLDFKRQNGIEIVRETAKRIPTNTYWGAIGYHTELTNDKVDEFLNALKNIDGVVAFNNQIPGVYSYYEIDENGEMIMDAENSGYYFVKAVVFQFDGTDEEKFKEEIELLAAPYYDDMNISISSFKGDRIYNWD